MSDTHHTSCTPSDTSLVWHCWQCGLDTPADDVERDRAELIEVLRSSQELRFKLIRQYGAVPECVLDFCNNARALLSRLEKDKP